MKSTSLFGLLEAASDKPAVFSRYTANELWTDRHTSEQMLAYHLNENIDVSSRRTAFIDDSVRWMTSRFELSGNSRICDFGCGPGLYTSRFAQLNAEVVGVDFSARSIAYAREYAAANHLDVTYVEDNYLEFEPAGRFDLITMIMCDFCALSPAQRAVMLAKFEQLLSDNGRIVLDVYSISEYDNREESAHYEKNQLNGFWSADPYYALVSSFKYDTEKVSLDKYTIVEADRQRVVYNWLQYFTPEALEQEVAAVGLEIEELVADVAGNPYDKDAAEFAVVLKRHGPGTTPRSNA